VGADVPVLLEHRHPSIPTMILSMIDPITTNNDTAAATAICEVFVDLNDEEFDSDVVDDSAQVAPAPIKPKAPTPAPVTQVPAPDVTAPEAVDPIPMATATPDVPAQDMLGHLHAAKAVEAPTPPVLTPLAHDPPVTVATPVVPSPASPQAVPVQTTAVVVTTPALTRPKSRSKYRDPSKTHVQASVGKRYDETVIADLRLRLRDYLEAIGVELDPCGKRLVGLCPGHNDRNPSFAVFGEDHDRCGCFVCSHSGNVFDTSMWLGRSTTFPEAVQDVATALGVFLPDALPGRATRLPKPPKPSKQKMPSFFPAAEPIIIQNARDAFCEAFYSGDKIIDRIVESLGIDRETLGKVAFGMSGLGLASSFHQPPWLCYTYPEGLKWRNPDATGNCRFYWPAGSATMPWRAELIRPETTTVYLTEGESDCLALIAAGLEDDGTTVCVASPGTSFQQDWASLFTGKRVILNFDSDDAGQTALHKVAVCLRPYAASLEIFNISTPSTNEQHYSN
jgi:hypothetical protein